MKFGEFRSGSHLDCPREHEVRADYQEQLAALNSRVVQETAFIRAAFGCPSLATPCCHRPSAIFHLCHAGHINRGNPNLAPFAGSFYSLSGGVNYYPHPNVTIRPEVRYDGFTGGGIPITMARRTIRSSLPSMPTYSFSGGHGSEADSLMRVGWRNGISSRRR